MSKLLLVSLSDELLQELLQDIQSEVTRRNTAKLPRVKSAQEIRDEIVEKAKRDVMKMKSRSGDKYDGVYFADTASSPHMLEFVVNREKRTVVALIKGKVSKRVYLRGIAKCHPNDCFNVHIGKAIALRRALGLKVPSEYLGELTPSKCPECGNVDCLTEREKARGIVHCQRCYAHYKFHGGEALD